MKYVEDMIVYIWKLTVKLKEINVETLEKELEEVRMTIKTDGYSMSVGEITNMYQAGELIIAPDYQRLFRWDDGQKSRLIESILIGIPLPSIFVAQDEEGRWEVVDGLQRISTLLQFQGVLKKPESDELYEPLTLVKTKYLPSLEGAVWSENDSSNGTKPLTMAQRLDIKRAKLDIKIIQRGSDTKTKFDLFQRLNSYGSVLSNQEIRNAALAGISGEFVAWLSNIAKDENFVALTSLSDSQLDSKYDEDLVLRFLMLSTLNDEKLQKFSNLQESLDDFSTEIASNFPNNKESLDRLFRETFEILNENEPNVFRKWDAKKDKFIGGFLISAFEAFAAGLGYCIVNSIEYNTNFNSLVKEFWNAPEEQTRSTGKSSETRIRKTLPSGRNLVANNE